MLISLNEIKKMVPGIREVPTAEILERIGSRLVEIEDAIDWEPKYKGIYIVKVVSAEKIPETHLSLCQVEAGERTAEFSEGETVQVVCGAPNVRAGMMAVWITPGAVVPQTYGNENFRLSVRKLRGYESNGMLAAVDELDLGTDHEGIAEIDPKMNVSGRVVQAGDAFAEAFGLNDVIIDVENKSLTHRPDCFGLVGFAREVAGIFGLKFEEPEWVLDDGAVKASGEVKVEVEVADGELCPRYSCAVFDIPKNEPSRYLTPEAVFLAKAGMRAIDPMVDATNIMMLMSGQPLHAFDYDKLVAVGGDAAAKIVVRAAHEGEELQLLDGKTIKCNPEDILITSRDVPVALAGAMGGKNTEIDASTKRVVLESATFSLYNLRKTQMAHGIFSEAITRFTKGQPAAMTKAVLKETMTELGVTALAVEDEWRGKLPEKDIKLTVEQINGLLGTTYRAEQIKQALENVGFAVEVTGEELAVKAAKWRTDVKIAEDVIEEVGRLLGFDNIALDLPKKRFTGTDVAEMWRLKKEMRRILSGELGMNELLTYSFISRDLLEKTGLTVDNSYAITNAISPELQCFRQQIAPSLLDKVRENLKAGHRDFALYEMNQIARKDLGLTGVENTAKEDLGILGEGVPVVETHLGIVEMGDFYRLKAEILTLLRRELHMEVAYQQLAGKAAEQYPYLEAKRSAALVVGDEVIGAFGEVKSAALKRFKLEQTVAAAEVNLEKVVKLPRNLQVRPMISRFPFVERDMTLKVAKDAQFGRFYGAAEGVLVGEGLLAKVTPVSVYQASVEDATKNISLHLKFASTEKTLAQEEISDIMKKVEVEVVKLGAEIV